MEKAPQNLELILKYFNGFTAGQLEQLAALDGLYKDWNSRINVISRKDIDSLYEKHVLHSLSIATIGEFKPGSIILDIGTGGGFPGVPLAIFFPDVQFHLVDSIGKKLKVVEEVCAAIGLQNVTTQHTRVEGIRNRKFDGAVSRAVAPLKELWSWCRPLLRKNQAIGTGISSASTLQEYIPPGLICLKGGDLTREIADSGTRPSLINIYEIFSEEYFKEKYLLFVKL